MYLNFFGLTENPFNVTPDPKFLYMRSRHLEALDQLQYGAHERGGFIVLTGNAGTGKTTLLQALRQRLDEDTAVSYVFNPTLPFDDIVDYLLEDLGIAKPEESPAGRLLVRGFRRAATSLSRWVSRSSTFASIDNVCSSNCRFDGAAGRLRGVGELSSCSGEMARVTVMPPRRSSRRSFRTGARRKRRGTWLSSNAGPLIGV